MKNGTDRNENDSKKGKKQFWETKPVLRNEKMVLKRKTGSEKQKATVQQLKKVLRYVGMRGKKRKITKRRKSLKSLLTTLVSFFYMVSFFIFYWFFFYFIFCLFWKILSQLEAASSVLPRTETFARCPSVVPEAQPRALREGNARRFLCSVEPRTQLLILT